MKSRHLSCSGAALHLTEPHWRPTGSRTLPSLILQHPALQVSGFGHFQVYPSQRFQAALGGSAGEAGDLKVILLVCGTLACPLVLVVVVVVVQYMYMHGDFAPVPT